MLKKVNPTVITLGIAGILAVAVGFYVNSVSWGPIAEEKTTQAAATDNGAKPANNNSNNSGGNDNWSNEQGRGMDRGGMSR